MTMEPEEDRIFQLSIALLEQTRAGKIVWPQTSRDDAFAFSGSNASVVISSGDKDGQPPYTLTVYDGVGNQVELVDTEEEGTSAKWWDVLSALYPLARRRARNIDPVIDSLFDDIGVAARDTPSAPAVRPRQAANQEMDVDDIPF